MAVAYNTKKCDCKLVEQNSGIAKVRFLHVIILFCQKGRNLKLLRASRYFKGTSKPAQTKRTLNKILRFEGSGLWLRRREKGYLFTELTISVTIELFAYTALQGLFHFSLHPQKVQQAWDESGLDGKRWRPMTQDPKQQCCKNTTLTFILIWVYKRQCNYYLYYFWTDYQCKHENHREKRTEKRKLCLQFHGFLFI